MAVLDAAEAVAGFLLVFFVPGYALTRAVFPEWHLAGPDARRRLLETVTLSFVLSVVLTVLLGYLLLTGFPGGFQASWSDPVLEASLALVAGAGFVAAIAQGAFSRSPPGPARLPADSGDEGAWELARELDRLSREERRLMAALAAPSGAGPETDRLQDRLAKVRAEAAAMRRQREEEYAR